MAGTPQEYSLRYRFTGQENQRMSSTRTVSRSACKLTGSEASVGKITRIVVKHFHSDVYARQHSYYAIFNWAGGSARSDTVSYRFGDATYMVNTITSGLPTAEQFAAWSSVTIYVTGNNDTHYWRATSTQPFDITVYYYDKKDMVDGAAPPTVSGVSCADDAGLLGTFGNYIQTYSRAVITGQYAIDNVNYPYLSAQHILTLADGDGNQIYTLSQTDNAVFAVGQLSAAGSVSWTYTVTDSAGNSVSASGTFSVLPYAPPTIGPRSAGVAIAQRYASTVDDTGQPVYLAAADGEHVWFDLAVNVTPIAGKNAWTLSLAYGQGDPTEDAGKQVASGADGASAPVKTYANDRSLVTEVVSPADDYWFRLTIADAISSASLTAYVDKGTALFDVEPDGVAVGMRSTGTQETPKFEVAETHESHFYGKTHAEGGIEGVTNYTSGEALTGGHWIDGKPIYRFVWDGNVKCTTSFVNVCSYPTISSIVRFDVYFYRGAGTVYVGDHNPSGNAKTYYTGSDLNWGNVRIIVGTEMTGTYRVCVILEYTKPDAADPALPEGPEIFDDDLPGVDVGVARADYIAMMAGIEIPDGETATVEPGAQADPNGGESPGIEGESAPSAKYETVALYHKCGAWSAAMVKNAVGKWITEAEGERILSARSTPEGATATAQILAIRDGGGDAAGKEGERT